MYSASRAEDKILRFLAHSWSFPRLLSTPFLRPSCPPIVKPSFTRFLPLTALMEQSAADQLPEADSLPDGFVESSTEPLLAAALISEAEKQDPSSNGERELVHGTGCEVDIHLPSEGRVEKSEKLRTFPVPLSEKGSFDADAVLAQADDEDNQKNVSIAVELGDSPLEDSAKARHDSGSCPSLAQENDEDKSNVSERPETCTKSPNTDIEGRSSESTGCPKSRKPECSSEVKVKPVKRSSKSEKELLELTLKYQHVIAERDAAISVREKLESLCRELQRQNKMLMVECKKVSVEGQNMRSDLSTKFNDAIKDVNSRLEVQKDECLSQLKENEMLRNKLKQLADQYALSEQQFQQLLKQKTLELQLADLKLQQHQEKSTQEQNQMQLYAEQVSQLLATEKNLRLQLAADGEKFQQFQDALLKTNEVFEAFKLEMEKMAKSIKDLKKENNFLKSKCEKSDVSLIELVEERELLKKHLEKVKSQKEKLESLCRLLQAERKQNGVGCNAT